MQLSIAWVIAAGLVGVWIGFLLCALMTMAREPAESAVDREPDLAA